MAERVLRFPPGRIIPETKAAAVDRPLRAPRAKPERRPYPTVTLLGVFAQFVAVTGIMACLTIIAFLGLSICLMIALILYF